MEYIPFKNTGGERLNKINYDKIIELFKVIKLKIESTKYKDLNVLDSNFNEGEPEAKKVRPENQYLIDSIGNPMDDITKYKRYIKHITQNMCENAKYLKFNLQKNEFEEHFFIRDANFHELVESNIPFNFNIMCFGKSLYYHLRYIYFILFNAKNNSEIINTKRHNNFVLYCDKDTFERYIKNFEEIKTNSSNNEENKSKEKEIWEKSNFFSEVLHKVKENKIEKDCSFVLQILKELNINIYFLVSHDKLIKGIGGKRAVMNYINYLISLNNPIPENYLCMYLDDNISGIVNLLTYGKEVGPVAVVDSVKEEEIIAREKAQKTLKEAEKARNTANQKALDLLKKFTKQKKTASLGAEKAAEKAEKLSEESKKVYERTNAKVLTAEKKLIDLKFPLEDLSEDLTPAAKKKNMLKLYIVLKELMQEQLYNHIHHQIKNIQVQSIIVI